MAVRGILFKMFEFNKNVLESKKVTKFACETNFILPKVLFLLNNFDIAFNICILNGFITSSMP